MSKHMLCKKEVMKQYVPWASTGKVDPTLQPNYQLTKYVQKLSMVLDHLIDLEAWFVGDLLNEQGRAGSFL